MVKTTSYSALAAAHFVFELERASFFMQVKGGHRRSAGGGPALQDRRWRTKTEGVLGGGLVQDKAMRTAGLAAAAASVLPEPAPQAGDSPTIRAW